MKAFYILSAELEELSKRENAKRTDILRANLESDGIAFKECIGTYKGAEERSFLVFDRDFALSNADYFSQESILHVDSKRMAQLIYVAPASDGSDLTEELGHWTSVSPYEIQKYDDYTWSEGQYYAIR